MVISFIAGKVLEAADAIRCTNLTCWSCGEVTYPQIYLMLIRPWKLQLGEPILPQDYVAVCRPCKIALNVALAIGALTEE